MFCLTIRKKILIKLIAAVCIAVLTISCNKRIKEEERPSYFHIDSLVSSQVNLLASSQAMLQKEAFVKGKLDTITYVPKDTTEWNRELDIFRELKAINKPVNR